MNNSAQITAAALIVAAATGFSAAGSLELDRAYASELKADAGARSVLNQPAMGGLDVHFGVRFGYTWNERDGTTESDDETTTGFQFHDAEVAVEGDVTDNMHARVSFDFGPDDSGSWLADHGSAELEDAFVDWTVNDGFVLRVGQFVPAFSAEASTSEYHMTNPFRSVTHEFVGTPGWTQGIQATWGADTWALSVGFNDGINSANTAVDSTMEADYAFNARFDFFGSADQDRFMDQSSWRGSDTGWRIGAGAFWQSSGETNDSSGADTDALFYTVDAAFEADGWSIWGAFYGSTVDPDGGTEYDNMGFEVGGSFFFTDQWEAFARWDTLLLDDEAGAGQVAAGGEDTQNFLSVGANYYFVPESQAAKLTLAAGFAFDETSDITGMGNSGFGTDDGLGNSGFIFDAADEDGQMMFSAIMQWMF